MGYEADYALNGETEEMEILLSNLLTNPDQQLYWENSTLSGDDFRAYVDRIREGT